MLIKILTVSQLENVGRRVSFNYDDDWTEGRQTTWIPSDADGLKENEDGKQVRADDRARASSFWEAVLAIPESSQDFAGS